MRFLKLKRPGTSEVYHAIISDYYKLLHNYFFLFWCGTFPNTDTPFITFRFATARIPFYQSETLNNVCNQNILWKIRKVSIAQPTKNAQQDGLKIMDRGQVATSFLYEKTWVTISYFMIVSEHNYSCSDANTRVKAWMLLKKMSPII